MTCKDKNKPDVQQARAKISKCLNHNYYYHGREWSYKNVLPRIIAESIMTDSEKNGLTDYKFYCFNGKVRYLYVSSGMENHKTAKIGFLIPKWEFVPFRRTDYKMLEKSPEKPALYLEMLEIAGKLSKEMKFARVDLYKINHHVYFLKFTLHPCSGFMPFSPREWDIILENLLQL